MPPGFPSGISIIPSFIIFLIVYMQYASTNQALVIEKRIMYGQNVGNLPI